MNENRRSAFLVKTLAVLGALSITWFAGAAFLKGQNPALAVYRQPDVCVTQIMMSRIIQDTRFGDWQQNYTVEESKKASGDYIARTTTSDGKVDIVLAQNGVAIQYWPDGSRPATSHPYAPSSFFLDENKLAIHKDLRKENPIVQIMGHKTYVLRHDTGSGYVDNYIAPDLGEVIMVYRHTTTQNGVSESLIMPVSIQVNQLNQELWGSVPKDVAGMSAKRK